MGNIACIMEVSDAHQQEASYLRRNLLISYKDKSRAALIPYLRYKRLDVLQEHLRLLHGCKVTSLAYVRHDANQFL